MSGDRPQLMSQDEDREVVYRPPLRTHRQRSHHRDLAVFPIAVGTAAVEANYSVDRPPAARMAGVGCVGFAVDWQHELGRRASSTQL